MTSNVLSSYERKILKCEKWHDLAVAYLRHLKDEYRQCRRFKELD